ncbi:MAG: DNA polymerase III subunit gamma/tau [Anaerolineaceae bacterium]|nr:DNA polymerase III subunit gamma/tau [Anaerolineaceae bacterium]
MSQAFYRKWRPRLWDQVVGQEHVVRTLQNAIRTERVGHAYLFAGPRGTGKTTTARLLAKAVNCLAPNPADRPCNQCAHCLAVNEGRFMDLIEIDAASNTSVDDIRDLREKINFSPSQGRYKVYIIDEVHMLSTAAFNALLKTLEEPPPHAIFILATTEAHKIPPTVLSRCQQHEFRRIPVNQIVTHLNQMCDEEKLEIEPEALTLIARQSTGSLRDAISLLDQLASNGEKITLATAQTVLGTATSQSVVTLIDAILEKKPADGLNCIHEALDGGTDPRQFARQVVDYLRNLMLIHLGNAAMVDATAEMRLQMAKQANLFDLPLLMAALRLFNDAAADTHSGWQPGLLLELALAEAIEGKPAAPQIQSQPRLESPQLSPTHTAEIPGKKTEPAQPVSPAKRETTAVQPEKSQPAKPAPAAAPKASTQPVQASQPTQAGGVTQLSMKQVLERVSALVKKDSAQTAALLNSCKIMTIKDGIVTLGFATDVLKSKMEMGDNLELTRRAASQVLAGDFEIVCTVNNSKSKAAPADMDVDNDGMVGTALNLGGQIVNKE